MLRTVIRNYIDNYQYDVLMEYLQNSYTDFRIADLDDVIEWENENPHNFKGKHSKYNEMLRIARKKCDEAQSLGFGNE